MKKLMIAAAAAALVGGAFAGLTDEGISGTAYNATISLKTTVGKAKTETTYYYLGKNVDGSKMWYEDETDLGGGVTMKGTIDADLANTSSAFVHKFTTKKISNQTVRCLTAAGKTDAATLALVKQLATTDKTGRNDDGATYGYKSAGKWCDQFSEKDEYCYRTAGTVKVSGILVDDCCAANNIGADFVYAFGGKTFANSKKVEIYAADASSAVIYNKDGTTAAATDNLKNDRTITALAIAGQGTFGAVKDNDGNGTLSDKRGIVSVSGNAVGTLSSALCTSCCVSGGISQNVWKCEDGSVVANAETAAYGTFSLKYNAAFTK